MSENDFEAEAAWERVLRAHPDAITSFAAEYPDQRACYVPFDTVREAAAELVESMFDGEAHRQEANRALQTVAGDIAPDALASNADVDESASEPVPLANVRLRGFPDDRTYRVGRQRSHHLGTIIGIRGRVVECETVEPLATSAAFECRECGHVNYVPQSFGRMMYPISCEGEVFNHEKGEPEECGERKNKSFLFQREKSSVVDLRQVTLAPVESNLDEPPTQTTLLQQDLVDVIGPDDIVTVNGYYDSYQHQKRATLSTYLKVWGLENEGGGETDKLSPAELGQRIIEEVQALQPMDHGSEFGADRDEVIGSVAGHGIRKREVEDRLDELEADNEVHEVGGGLLMVE